MRSASRLLKTAALPKDSSWPNSSERLAKSTKTMTDDWMTLTRPSPHCEDGMSNVTYKRTVALIIVLCAAAIIVVRALAHG